MFGEIIAVYCENRGMNMTTLSGQNILFFMPVCKIRKSDCLSVPMKQLGSHRTDSQEILNLSTFRKFVEKIQVPLKSDKNNRHFTWRTMYIYGIILPNFSYN